VSVILGMSAKGSPGVSLGMWGLLHCWPRPVFGLEADMSGGTWALSHSLTWEPGLMDLASEQAPITDSLLQRCSITVAESKRVICAPKEPLSVQRGIEWVADRLSAWPESIDVLVDIGRTDATHPMIQRADAVVVWTRTTPQALGPTASLSAGLERGIRPGVDVSIVTVGDRPYSGAETVEALTEFAGPRLRIRHGASLPFELRLAEILETGGRKAARLCNEWYEPLAMELSVSNAHRPLTLSSEPEPLAASIRETPTLLKSLSQRWAS
jgi:hypothetical protein